MLRGRQFSASVILSIALGLGCSVWQWQRNIDFVYAAKRGNIDAVRSSLEHGVRPDAVGWQGMHALSQAAMHRDVAMARLLLTFGADPGAAMGQATACGNSRIVTMLLRAGARMSRSQAASALCDAAESGDIAYARLLLHHGASVNDSPQWGNHTGLTPILWASCGSWQMFDFLAERGADVTARSSDGSTALMWAAGSGGADRLLICRNLIRRGVNVNYAFHGETALMTAVSSEIQTTPAVLDLLLSHGANPRARDSHGKTALDYARKFGHKQSAERLRLAEIAR